MLAGASELDAPPPMMPSVAPEHPALTAALHSAVADPSIAPASAATPPPPDLTLTPREKTTIRNRSAIMARHVHGMAPEFELRARLGAALSPLAIDPTPEGAMDGPRQFAMGGHPAMGGPALADASADSRAGWVHEYRRNHRAQTQPAQHPGRWADDFARMSLAERNAEANANAAAALLHEMGGGGAGVASGAASSQGKAGELISPEAADFLARIAARKRAEEAAAGGGNESAVPSAGEGQGEAKKRRTRWDS